MCTEILHALRVKGLATVAELVEITGFDASIVTETLSSLSTREMVIERTSGLPRWTLTPSGRTTHRNGIDECASPRVRALLTPIYFEWCELNAVVKRICTDWQVRGYVDGEMVLNDHSDPGYDAAVVSHLTEVHSQSRAVIARLSAVLQRFNRYAVRLDFALARIQAGDRGALAKPLSNSYHDIWMELHQDLLITLDMDRSEDG